MLGTCLVKVSDEDYLIIGHAFSDGNMTCICVLERS